MAMGASPPFFCDYDAVYIGRNLRSFLKNQILKCRHYVSPKRRQVYATLYGVTFHETALLFWRIHEWRIYFDSNDDRCRFGHTNMTGGFKYRAFLLSRVRALLLCHLSCVPVSCRINQTESYYQHMADCVNG